jgi:hypothetical protein
VPFRFSDKRQSWVLFPFPSARQKLSIPSAEEALDKALYPKQAIKEVERGSG